MHADGNTGFFRRLVDWPIAALAERLNIAAEQEHLHEILVAGAFANFGGCRHRILIADDDRRLQPLVLAGPFVDLPVVDRRAERSRKLVIADALPGAERIEHAELHIVWGSRCCCCMKESEEPCGPPSGG